MVAVYAHAEFVVETESIAGATEQYVEVTWSAESGWLYFAQASETLEDESWDYLPEAIDGTNVLGVLTFFPERPEEPATRFVRVIRTADLGGSGESQDNDLDGLTNAEEFANLTDPLDADTDDDGLPDGWEVAHGLAPLSADAGGLFQGGPTTNIEAYQAGVQGVPNASMANYDGDDLANVVDADPNDAVINWRAGPPPRFVIVELDIPNVEDLQLIDFTPQGTIWFRRLSSQTNVVVDRSLQVHEFPAEAQSEGEFGAYGDTLVAESVPGYRLQSGVNEECLWDPQANSYTTWQCPTGYHDDLCDERDGLLLGTNWQIPLSSGGGVKQSPNGSPLPDDDSIGSSNARIEANKNVVSDLAYWRWDGQLDEYSSPAVLPSGSAVRSATVVQSLEGHPPHEWSLVAAGSAGVLVSRNGGEFLPSTEGGSLHGGTVSGVTRQGWAIDSAASRIWANGAWNELTDLVGTPTPEQAEWLDILDSGLGVARFRRLGEAWRIALLPPVEIAIPQVLQNGNEVEGKLAVATELKIAKMQGGEIIDPGPNASSGEYRINEDKDRFYVRLGGIAEDSEVSVLLQTGHAQPEYRDPATRIDLVYDQVEKLFTTKSMVLVADDNDDAHSQDLAGEEDDMFVDEFVGDRSHKSALNGIVRIASVKINGNEHPLSLDLPIKARKQLTVKIYRVKKLNAGLPMVPDAVVNEHIKALKERYAQVGLQIVVDGPLIKEIPNSINLDDGYQIQDDGIPGIVEEEGAFLEAVATEDDGDIEVFYVPFIADISSPEEESTAGYSYVPSKLGEALESVHNNIVMSGNATRYVLAHELGHILLNSGSHDTAYHLMSETVNVLKQDDFINDKRFRSGEEAVILQHAQVKAAP